MKTQQNLFQSPNPQKSFPEICAILGCDTNSPAWPDRFGDAIQRYLLKNKFPPIETLSLFSGAGGLDIGFSDVGFNMVESVEIEDTFCKTIELNSGPGRRFDKVKVRCMDIRGYSGEHLEHVDFIIGGPPCQTFSAAGRRANGVSGTTDERGVLFREYVRLLRELSPKGFLFENVYGIIGAQHGEAWKEILNSFSSIKYRLFYRILDAADYGVPQHRERLFIVGLKDGTFQFPRPTHGPDSIGQVPFYNAGTAVRGLALSEEEGRSGIHGRYGCLLNDIPPGLNYSFYTENMGHPNPIFAWRSKFSDFLYKADPNEPVRTIKASGGAYTGPFHWNNRFFSYGEYKRLQTFPDDYQINGGKPTAIRQIGNSVPPQMARIMAIAIRQQIFQTEFPFMLPLLEDSEKLTFRQRKRELTAIYRKKAALAIHSLKVDTSQCSVSPVSHSYFASMSPNFGFSQVDSGKAEYKVDVCWSDCLTISLKDHQRSGNLYCASIRIFPNKCEWVLGVQEVSLQIQSNHVTAFTAAWKAFEWELMSNSIKADLIQLNGYYQYDPKLSCHMDGYEAYQYGSILQKIVSGQCIAKIYTAEELCFLWELDNQELENTALALKSLGYEIRNHNTNPQIHRGCWLIPYAFPTLNPLSVQLRKRVV